MNNTAFDVAMGLEQSGDVENAVICYQTLMADDARAAVNLGVIHHKAKSYGLAADALRHAVKLDPNFALAWYNLGCTLDALMRTAEAIQAQERAVKLNPRYADAHYNLAVLLETSGLPRRAVKHWRAYVKLDPIGKAAERARRSMKRTVRMDKLKLTPVGGWAVTK